MSSNDKNDDTTLSPTTSTRDFDTPNELPPLPNIPKARNRGWSNAYNSRGTSTRTDQSSQLGVSPINQQTTFQPLAPTSSRLSQRSANRSFIDSVGFVSGSGLDLTQVETRTLKVGKGFVAASGIKEGDREDGDEEKEGKEIEVAVQITPDGTEITFPDGGLEAYLVLAGGVCAAFSAFGLAASIGGFQTYYRTNFLSDYSSGQIAWIGATQAFVCFFISVFTGPLFDLYGHRPLVAGGTIILCFGFCMLSLCTQYWQVIICHATLISVGMDLLFIAPVGVVGQWFALKRGMAFGVLMTGSSAGAIIWPVILANVPQLIGFGWTLRLMALIAGMLGTASFFLMKTRLPPKPPGPFFYTQAFKKLPYTLIAASCFCWVFGFFSAQFFIGTYGQIVGVGTLAPYLLTIMNGSSGFGRVMSGIAGDRFGPHNVVIIFDAIMVILMFSWIGIKTAGGLIAFCVLYGFASGAFVSLQAPLISCHADDQRFAATMVGQALMVQSFAQLIGPPVFGLLLGTGSISDQLANFPKAIALGSTMILLSCLLKVYNKFAADRSILGRV